MKKVIIIGAGIAGLSAGIFARKAGYETIIYEKNTVPGGNCSAWYRNGYCIDNCIHWMTWTKDGSSPNYLWQEVGALYDGIHIIQRDSFYCSEWEGEQIALWRDLDRTREDMLRISPEDESEINCFIDYVRLAATLLNGDKSVRGLLHTINETNFYLSHMEFAKYFVRYFDLDLEGLSGRFQHPLLQHLILDFSVKEYEAYWLLLSYAFFISGNGDIPEGGSMGVVKNMLRTYEESGGILYLNTPVEKILLHPEKSYAEAIQLSDGKTESADYIICACDMNYTFHKLLQPSYAPRTIKEFYDNKRNTLVYSSFQVAFAVDGLMQEVNDTLSISTDSFKIATQTYERITIKNYRIYGDYIAPKGKTVIQCSFVQYKDDYQYWAALYQNRTTYCETKQQIAGEIQARILSRFPEYTGKLTLLDVWTPASYANRLNNYQGAYMRFLTTAFNRNAFLSNSIKGLTNVFLANHWLRYPGGIPTAVYMGKLAVKLIEELEH